ncbi:MAG: hypothetical protein ICV87_08585 [Gemmatimonadetes bacterium]|nr:hypothetical protein [Gemmatimonadota bacterium]
MRILARALAAALVVLAACVSSQQPDPNAGPRGTRNVITLEEIRATRQNNLYDVIHRVRPAWLRARTVSPVSPGTDGGVQVYRENTRIGSVGVLYSMSVDNVARLEFLDASSAQLKYGHGNSNGVIVVVIGDG